MTPPLAASIDRLDETARADAAQIFRFERPTALARDDVRAEAVRALAPSRGRGLGRARSPAPAA